MRQNAHAKVKMQHQGRVQRRKKNWKKKDQKLEGGESRKQKRKTCAVGLPFA